VRTSHVVHREILTYCLGLDLSGMINPFVRLVMALLIGVAFTLFFVFRIGVRVAIDPTEEAESHQLEDGVDPDLV
jgi:hypothetical protein